MILAQVTSKFSAGGTRHIQLVTSMFFSFRGTRAWKVQQGGPVSISPWLVTPVIVFLSYTNIFSWCNMLMQHANKKKMSTLQWNILQGCMDSCLLFKINSWNTNSIYQLISVNNHYIHFPALFKLITWVGEETFSS